MVDQQQVRPHFIINVETLSVNVYSGDGGKRYAKLPFHHTTHSKVRAVLRLHEPLSHAEKKCQIQCHGSCHSLC
jgi:uncharacterized protein YfaP (DUF2135 family)